jgi:hypothetical protein
MPRNISQANCKRSIDMPWIIGGAMLGSALLGGAASSKAAKSQEQAQREANAAQERMFNKQVELQEPFRKVGVNALPDLVAASKYTPFTMQQFQADPGYAFRMQEGLKALDRSAAARGGLLSGATLKGAQRYGQDLGSQEYTNAFNRYQIERQARLNPLQSLAGMSQTAANTLTNAAGQYGQDMAQGAAAMGNIRASGYMNQANALTGALGQGVNYYQNQQMMDRFFPKRPGYNQTSSLQNWSNSQAGYLDPSYDGP